MPILKSAAFNIYINPRSRCNAPLGLLAWRAVLRTTRTDFLGSLLTLGNLPSRTHYHRFWWTTSTAPSACRFEFTAPSAGLFEWF